MVDIAAQLSLIPSSPALDPAAILGAESADVEAFGNILATQIHGKAGTGAPASPLPPLPIPAGLRQPAGKILPGAAQILPDAAIATLEAPALQALPAAPAPAQATAAQLVSAGLAAKLAASVPQPAQPAEPNAPEAVEAAVAQRAETSPVHGLLKMLAAAFKGQSADETTAEETGGPRNDQETAEGEGPDQDAAAGIVMPLGSPIALPILPAAAATAPQPIEAQRAAALTAPVPPVHTAAAQPAEAQAAADQMARLSVAEARSGAVLTVAGARPEGPPPAVTLEAAPTPAAGKVVTARVELAPASGREGAPLHAGGPAALPVPRANRSTPADAPVLPERASAVARSIMADRVAQAEGSSAEAAPSPLLPAATESRPHGVGLPAAAATTAPAVEMPRQDFAALVERLIEARNAGATQSSHASVRHAEFGQVSLQFQQDGKDLSVSMSSADPDFAVAVQAAMPAERQASADTASRNQSQSQSQSQSAGNSAASQQDAAGQRGEGGDQQGRNGRNPRGGANPGNPSQRWADNGQAQNRNGIFA